MRSWFAGLFIFIFSHVLFSAEVTSFNPEGNVKSIKQVLARFSTDMTPLGDPRDTIHPFTIYCRNPNGKEVKIPASQSRWADTKNWSLDYDSPLPAGVNCTFTTIAELKDVKGEAVKAASFSFSTQGPAVVSIQPYASSSIEPEQYFILTMDGEVEETSVEKLAYFEVEGLKEKVPVKIISGNEREMLIKNRFGVSHKKDFEEFTKKVIILGAKRKFPESAKIVLDWPAGILSKSGIAVTEAQTFNYDVLAPFRATFSCSREDEARGCNPISKMYVEFNSEVLLKDVENIRIVSGRDVWKPAISDNEMKEDQSKTIRSIAFKGRFPEKRTFKIELPAGLKDELGRPLSNASQFPLSVSTEGYSPLIKFNARFGIIEAKTESYLPVSVRNVEKNMAMKEMIFEGKTLNLNSLDQIKKIIELYSESGNKSEYPYHDEKTDKFIDPRNEAFITDKSAKNFTLPKTMGEKDFEMMGILLKNPGFYAVEIKSPRLGESLTTGKGPMYVHTTALVTNLGVHFKKGVESSLVFVTELDSAKPAAGVSVSIRNCLGDEILKGITDKEGLFKTNKLPKQNIAHQNNCYGGSDDFFVFAKKGDDLSFMNTSWSKGIESWRFQFTTDREYNRASWGTFIGHTVFDRTLFHPGETVQMKHIIREHHQNGFTMPDKKFWPKRVLILHSGSGKVYEFPFKMDAGTGTAINSFKLSNEIPLGNYEVYLSHRAEAKASESEGDGEEGSDNFDRDAKHTGSFLVSEFRLPLINATVKIQGDKLIKTEKVNVDLSAQYMSGGPATKLAVKTRAQLQRAYAFPQFPGSEDYSFYGTPVKTGIVEREDIAEKIPEVITNDLTLDNAGGALLSLQGLATTYEPQSLTVEMEYTDPNGEVKTASGSKIIYPSRLLVGLRTDSWFGSSDETKILGVVVDTENNLQKKVKYKLHAFKSFYYSHRKRLVGGFYAYDSKTEIKSLGVVCEGESDDEGRFLCVLKNLPSGEITLQATVADENNNQSYARTSVSLFAKGEDSWWTPGDSDRIDVLPEKKSYGVNETAKMMVKTPFKEATALVTIEREGILDQFITTIKRDNPLLSVPMKPSYAPNVYVSVMLVRGRVSEPRPDFLVDLGKPAMKLGIANVKVGWDAHKLNVEVSSDKNKYNIKDQARITIKVESMNKAKLPKNSEVILAVVDESLFYLKNNESVNLLNAMMEERGHGVETSSAMNEIIGRRHFGLKAKPPGGGGGLGASGLRENFEPLIAFIPNLKIDERGEAHAVVKLNDSISSFRIIAVAHAGTDLFGTGKRNIITNKDLILYSGIAPVSRNGDRVENVFTVRNTTEKNMKVKFEAKVSGIKNLPELPSIELAPSESKTITLPVTIPDEMKELSFEVNAVDQESGAHDDIKVKEKITPAVPERVLQATLFQLDKTNTLPVKQPADAIAQSGKVLVDARATLVSGLSGVKSYMENYPYTCLEQRTSKAIVLNRKKDIEDIIQNFPSFMDADGLLKFFDWPRGCGSTNLTHYVLDILDENGYSKNIPDEQVSKMIEGMKKDLNGTRTCWPWWMKHSEDKYFDELKIQTLETLSRYSRFDKKIIETIKITPNQWSNETLTNWITILKREQKEIAGQEELLKNALNILKARVNFQGSQMSLQESLNSEGSWRLFSSNDQEALKTFKQYIDEMNNDDAGRMARGLIARLKRGHWDTTMANAWGMTVFRKFSERFEKVKPTGTTSAIAGREKAEIDWKITPAGKKADLNWPAGSQEKEVEVVFTHNGSGKPWIHLETSSAIPLKNPMNFGFGIAKKITPIDQKKKGKWSVGDVIEVELQVKAGTDQSWVVVNDPLPTGASHIGTGLDGESSILQSTQRKSPDEIADWPTEYEEKGFSRFVSYAGYLYTGTYKIHYRYRLNSAGHFRLPPTRVEALYSPEVFGEIPNEEFDVAP